MPPCAAALANERGENTLSEILLGRPKRGNQVGEKPDRVVVSFIKRHPGDGSVAILATRQPLNE